jgi:hypothetical protein
LAQQLLGAVAILRSSAGKAKNRITPGQCCCQATIAA